MPVPPIHNLLPALQEHLSEHSTVVLEAPPGAGKTTAVPPALLDSDWLVGRKILLLEPRRLAARAAARYMAAQMGQEAGGTVGYRTRLDSRISRHTRIEVVTEGILTRMIQSDPALEDFAAVLFDEFHERSLQADLGLALTRESQQSLRPDLRILVMSATLDTGPVSRLLGDAPVIRSEGRAWPVDTRYLGKGDRTELIPRTAGAIRRALREESGSVLVFLPGVGEIRRLVAALDGELPADTQLAPLYGQLSPEAQDRAIAPSPQGQRKVVLATAIAETSLTIEGIRIVIDAGLSRSACFDPNSGMTRLLTRRVSRASADQRRGRAGRTQAGVCYRLWSESEQAGLAAFSPAEILEADLAPLVLELAQWGIQDPQALIWLDPPPPAHWQQAVTLLQWLAALDDDGRITAHGRDMLALGLHPRLAHMLLRGRAMGCPALAAHIAALLEERDPLDPREGVDLELRLRLLSGADRPRDLPRQRLDLIRRSARKLADGHTLAGASLADTGRLLAQAFPDRIARRRPGGPARYQLSNGRGAFLDPGDPLAGEEWLATAALDGQAREARVFLAAAVTLAELEEDLSEHFRLEESVDWDDRRGTVVARRARKLGAITVAEERLPAPGPEQVEAGLLAAIRRKGLDSLPWNEGSRQYRARMALLHALQPTQWPDVSEERLLADLEHFLGPFLAGMSHWRDLSRLDLTQVLKSLLDYPQQQQLEQLAPSHLTVPSGQAVRLDYAQDQGPVLAVKLQAVFGLSESPRLAGGTVPVVFHLLSPAGRPLAVTADLASFWRQAYPDVRKDMRGRYPKHPWPEDPLTAEASMRVKSKKE